MNGCYSWTAKGNTILFLMFWTGVPIRVLSSGTSRPSKDALINILDVDPQLCFLRNKDHFASSAQGVRPYTLSLNKEDYHYGPKPKHLRPARLIRLLGSSFDPFWMSIERPAEADTSPPASDVDTLAASAARYRQKLEKEAADLDLSALSVDAAASLRKWLVQSATCSLRHTWVDLGPVFWPRWLRHTDCEKGGSARACSFPSGMACRRAQVTHLKILAWHCWGRGDDVGEDCAREARRAEKRTGPCFLRKKCLWRQVPYPVVTACKCACK
uniref:Noggin n=1 Tax=Electrophorus electricus TaxID=8005 RepID=A0A4W4EEU6_ELEEL